MALRRHLSWLSHDFYIKTHTHRRQWVHIVNVLIVSLKQLKSRKAGLTVLWSSWWQKSESEENKRRKSVNMIHIYIDFISSANASWEGMKNGLLDVPERFCSPCCLSVSGITQQKTEPGGTMGRRPRRKRRSSTADLDKEADSASSFFKPPSWTFEKNVQRYRTNSHKHTFVLCLPKSLQRPFRH